ncbi:hypothetical protein GCM10011490_22370 [Pseudoclavibacter endophyticus]|uniref:DUF3180 domain-containing protein n=1 Tax=Pseudoclavibacter endophyticus TaxID=1778590 RepID=UPI00166B2171|nr:DUF3180 domain-containing protein [Pseudoclavibacter endophyticus]GGA71223.1 hypothetical protein GCM10011490_22370 [Pseudoclavibacter endophyticus]
MTQRTRPLTLILLAIVAGVLAWIVEVWLVSTGFPMLVPPVTLPVTLVIVALALLALAWPIRTYTRALRRQRDAIRDARSRRPDADPDAAGDDSESTADRRRDATPPKRVDPVLAVRVLAFAKASSMAASVIGGAMVAATVYVVTRPVIAESLLPLAIAGLVGAAVLLVAGLLAESWCALPPEDGANARATAPPRPALGG